jgi:predicted GNAT family N-acyltransferase
MIPLRIERVRAELKGTDTGSAYRSCLEIRRIVFTEGQGVPLELEFDGLDGDAEHFIAWRLDETSPIAVGTARLRRVGDDAKAERVAVLESERGGGVGRALMAAIETRAQELGLAAIILNAQLDVIPFYEGLEYHARGEVFEEAGIDHRSMSKSLDLPSSRGDS